MTDSGKLLMWIGIGALTVYVARLAVHVRTEASMARPSESDKLAELLPSFRAKVAQLLLRMRTEGFRPLLKNAYRTPEQAAKEAAEGEGIANSMHTLRLAADIIDAKTGWGASQAFKDALSKHAKALGLVQISRTQPDGTKRLDWAHVQAIPVKDQNRYRAAKTDAARETMLQKQYAA